MPVLDLVIPSFNNAEESGRTVAALRTQALPAGWERSIWIADDGSAPGHARALEALQAPDCRIIRLERNGGRSAARNAGAAAGRGEVIVFIDSDCVFPDAQGLARLLQAFAEGADAGFGLARARGDTFWARYQNEVAEDRVARFAAGDLLALTTALCAVRREAFQALGGFDERYRRYGFEDRDLLARLRDAGQRIELVAGAVVFHDAELSLREIARKMREAGAQSAGLFLAGHRADYLAMPYSRIDLRIHPWLLWLPGALSVLLLPLARGCAEALLGLGWVPHGLKRMAVRGVSALAYLRGSWSARGGG